MQPVISSKPSKPEAVKKKKRTITAEQYESVDAANFVKAVDEPE